MSLDIAVYKISLQLNTHTPNSMTGQM